MHFLLIYDVVENYVEARQAYRNEHLALAKEFFEAEKLVLGGALEDPVDQAILLFNTQSETEINDFVERDPYVKHGLIKRWRIRKWNTVVGINACQKLV